MQHPALSVRLAALLITAILAFATAGYADQPAPQAAPIIGYDTRFHPVLSEAGMVVSADIIASRVGAHSPDERAQISSVQKFRRYVQEVLARV